MKDVNSHISLSDMFDLLQKISYIEAKTVENILQNVILDLKSDKSVNNLKALYYFTLFKVNKCPSESLYPYENLLIQCLELLKCVSDKDVTICALLCSVIENCLPLIKKEHFNIIFVRLLEFVESNVFLTCVKGFEQTDCCVKLSISLLVLEKVCSFISTYSVNELKFPCSLIETIVNFIPTLSLEMSRKTLVPVLPKLIYALESNVVLEKVWLQLINLQSNENNNGKQLFYLCLLCDHFVSPLPSKFALPLHHKPEFWKLLQQGLCNENGLYRKQSLYLLKRCIEMFEENNLEIDQNNFYWSDKHKVLLIEFWNKIFILLEVLEEKQTHLITPALNNFNEILSLCSANERVCYSWLYCVFIRLLNHSSLVIVKWSLNEFCNLDVGPLLSDSKWKVILSCFFNSLNNMFLFSIECNSTTHFNQKVLEKWFIAISAIDAFESVLECLTDISWSPIPLFFVISAVSRIPPKPLLNLNSIGYLRKILNVTLKNQCIFIRSAIQCRLIKILCQLNRSDIDLITITNILGLFSGEESLKRGTDTWNKCVDWIKNMPLSEIYLFFNSCSDRILKISDSPVVQTSLSIPSLARMFILIIDSENFAVDGVIKKTISSLVEQFFQCEKRIYSCTQIQDNCVEFLECLIEESNTLSCFNSDENTIIKLIQDEIPDLLNYINTRLQRGSVDNIETASLYNRTLREILKIHHLANLSSPAISKLVTTALSLLSTNLDIFQEYLSIKIVHHYCKYLLKRNKMLEKTYEKAIINDIFKRRLFSKNLRFPSVDPLLNLRGKLVSEVMYSLWCTFVFYLECSSNMNAILAIFPIPALIELAFDGISDDGKQSLIPILKAFVHLLPLHKNIVDVKRFIVNTWNSCFELRKNELFWYAINEWIRMVYQDGITGNIDYHDTLNDYASQIMILGEELVGLVDIFVEQCTKLRFNPELSEILSKALLFGTILRKDRRMESDVCQLIVKEVEAGYMESFGSGMELKTDREVCLKALNILLTRSDAETRSKLIALVVNELLSCDIAQFTSNKRYFNDSLIHRKKNKLLQALLIIENYIFLHPSTESKDLPASIYDWVLQSLISSSQQPSVRYQLEWLFVRINLHYPTFINSFWSHFSKAGNERLGSMCSFISIAYHLSLVLNDSRFLEQCIDNILPWCMSQNFNIRLYAQVLLSKLWDFYPELSKKYHCFTKNQWKIYEQEGNMLLNAKKMESDFYFNVFHPIKHFTLRTIYWDLPRLSNICAEEWIDPDNLGKYEHLCFQKDSVDDCKSLAACDSPNWIIKNTGIRDERGDGSSIQKKFIPWKSMFKEDEDDSDHRKGGVVLVASLVDKAANLGGLARTCEVFAAKELVVSNLDVTKEKEFISLSMTAEKHMTITEVKAHNLVDYLKGMKSMGYTLVGAEQTTGSVPLTSYQFPEQCILLLGNEKEGIPPNLLPLLEAYIEIPQLGLVRSLNVHVTGAIFLWEYSKQHSFNNR